MPNKWGQKWLKKDIPNVQRRNWKELIYDTAANLDALDIAKASLGLVSRYAFAGNGNDSHGTKHLTAVNTPTYVVGFPYGQAADLEAGSSMYYEGTTSDHDLVTGDLWCSLFWTPESVGTEMTLAGKRDPASATNKGWQVVQDTDGKIKIRICDGSASRIEVAGATVVQAGTTYWILAILDRNGNGRILLDGVEDGSGAISAQQLTASNAVNFRIGRSGGASTNYADGIIDHVQIGTTIPTTQDQIDAMFYDLHAGQHVTPAGTASIWVKGNRYVRDEENTKWVPESPFRGTGAEIAALVTNKMTHPGLICICTASGSGFLVGLIYRRNAADSAWEPFIATNAVVFPAPAGSDYAAVQNTNSVASSTATSDTTTNFDTSGTASASGRMDDTSDMAGELVTATGIRNKKLKSATFNCGGNGTPTGAVVAKLIRASDGAELATSTTSIDASTMGTVANRQWDFPDNAITPNENFRVALYYPDGTASNYIYVRYAGSNVSANGQKARRAKGTGVWTDTSGDDSRMSVVTTDVALYFASDGNGSLTERWKSNSEANPYIYIDLGSEKLISGCRIFWLTAGRPTTYNIDVSRDAVAWTTIKAETAQPAADAYTEYAWNTVVARYIRVQAQETIAMEISELQYYSKATDQAIAAHGHGGAIT